MTQLAMALAALKKPLEMGGGAELDRNVGIPCGGLVTANE